MEILKNLQTKDCIKSIVILFSGKLSRSLRTIFVSDRFGVLLYILEKETMIMDFNTWKAKVRYNYNEKGSQ